MLEATIKNQKKGPLKYDHTSDSTCHVERENIKPQSLQAWLSLKSLDVKYPSVTKERTPTWANSSHSGPLLQKNIWAFMYDQSKEQNQCFDRKFVFLDWLLSWIPNAFCPFLMQLSIMDELKISIGFFYVKPE